MISIDLLSIFISLKRKWYFIVFIPLIAATLAFILTKGLKEQYVSFAQLSTGITSNNPINFEEKRKNYLDINIEFSNLIQTLNSSRLLSQVTYRLILHDLENKIPFKQEKLNEYLSNASEHSFKEDHINFFKDKLAKNSILDAANVVDKKHKNIITSLQYDHLTLRKNLLLYRLNNTDYINISFKSESPELSAFVINTLLDELLNYFNESTTLSSQETIQFYEKLVNDKKKYLASKTFEIIKYSEENNIHNREIENQSKVNINDLLQNERINELKNIREISLEIEILEDRLGALKKENAPDNSTNINQKILNIQKKINQLNSDYIESGQNDKNILDSISYYRHIYTELSVKNDNKENIGNTSVKGLNERISDLKLQLRISKSNLADFETRLSYKFSSSKNYAAIEEKLSDLNRERDLAENEYLRFQDKLNQVKTSYLTNFNNIKITLKAQPADEPVNSRKILYPLLGYLGSLMIVIIFIVFIEILDTAIKNPRKFNELINMNLIGVLLNLKMLNNKFNYEYNVFNSKNNDNSNFLEYLRKIRSDFEPFTKKLILITSLQQKQGKSFFIRNIAISLSNINKKVLIIDLNFKNNTISKFELTNKPQKYYNPKLINKINLMKKDLNFDKFIYPIIKENVYMIGCDKIQNSPSEIFSNIDIKLLLTNLKTNFDYILIEGPALNEFSDSRELEKISDVVFSIISATSAMGQLDKNNLNYFKSINEKFKGFILNNVHYKDLIES